MAVSDLVLVLRQKVKLFVPCSVLFSGDKNVIVGITGGGTSMSVGKGFGFALASLKQEPVAVRSSPAKKTRVRNLLFFITAQLTTADILGKKAFCIEL